MLAVARTAWWLKTLDSGIGGTRLECMKRKFVLGRKLIRDGPSPRCFVKAVVELKNTDVIVRTAVQEDIPHILELLKEDGRYYSFDELWTWMEFDPGCIVLAEARSTSGTKKIIGSLASVILGPSLGAIGLSMIDKNFRDCGLGMKMGRDSLERLRNRNVYMCAYYKQSQDCKEHFGFQHFDDFTTLYYQCFEFPELQHRPRVPGLNIATIFEGQLVTLQSQQSLQAVLPKTTSIDGVDKERLPFSISSSIAISNDNINDKSSRADLKAITDTSNRYNEVESEDDFDNITVAASPGTNYEKYITYSNFVVPPSTSRGYPSAEKSDNHECGLSAFETFPPQNDSLNKPTTASGDTSLSTFYLETKDVPANGFSGKNGPSSADFVLNGVLSYDRFLHKRDRSFLVKRTLSWKSCRTKVALKSGVVVGYASLRCVHGDHWAITPFYADSENIAEILLFELLSDFDFAGARRSIIVRFPDKNVRCLELLQKYGFRDRGHF